MKPLFNAAFFSALIAAMPDAGAAEDEARRDVRAPSFLSFQYENPAEPSLAEMADVLRASRILEGWTGYVGARLPGVPVHVEVRFTECGKAGSWYHGRDGRIDVCYEEISSIYTVLEQHEPDGGKRITAWVGSILAELYHELGHALIRRLSLPVTGREEDATDQFAVLALLNHPGGADLVLGYAEYLNGMAKAEQERGVDPSQRHPSYAQRYYNVLCWTYGSDPEAHKRLVESQQLPGTRAETCGFEYLLATYAWEMLLAPFERQ